MDRSSFGSPIRPRSHVLPLKDQGVAPRDEAGPRYAKNPLARSNVRWRGRGPTRSAGVEAGTGGAFAVSLRAGLVQKLGQQRGEGPLLRGCERGE